MESTSTQNTSAHSRRRAKNHHQAVMQPLLENSAYVDVVLQDYEEAIKRILVHTYEAEIRLYWETKGFFKCIMEIRGRSS